MLFTLLLASGCIFRNITEQRLPFRMEARRCALKKATFKKLIVAAMMFAIMVLLSKCSAPENIGLNSDSSPTLLNARKTNARARVEIPFGTRLDVAPIDTIGTDKNSSGDSFSATLISTLTIDGEALLEEGTLFRGRVRRVEAGSGANRPASISLELIGIVSDRDALSSISTDELTVTAEAISGGKAGKQVHFGSESRLSFTLSTTLVF
jgi:hypothetical protein